MKTLHDFTLRFPLVSSYAGSTGLQTIRHGELYITGGYYYAGDEPIVDHTHYELAPGTTLNNLMEWLQYNTDAQIVNAVEEYIAMMELLR